jgi:hypothetical protein
MGMLSGTKLRVGDGVESRMRGRAIAIPTGDRPAPLFVQIGSVVLTAIVPLTGNAVTTLGFHGSALVEITGGIRG